MTRIPPRLCLALALALAAPSLAHAKPAAVEGPVYVFQLDSHFLGTNGTNPVGGVVRDPLGNLFGTTSEGGATAVFPQPGYGTIYEISPASTGSPSGTFTVLHSFANDGTEGGYPETTPVRAPDATLYGTTTGGGRPPNYGGTVYSLTPPAAGQTGWTLTTIYNFGKFAQGFYPVGKLYRTPSGTLYGAAAYGIIAGVIYSLTPPAAGSTTWTYRTLYRFQNGADGGHPTAGVIGDGDRALYGTTTTGGANGSGTIFRLTPQGAGQEYWTETVLYDFSYVYKTAFYNDLVADAAGNLYGTGGGNSGGGAGTAYELSPPPTGKSQWSYATIATFKRYRGTSPRGPLLPDAQGGFYGTTSGGGTGGGGVVFHLAPPAAGQTAWTETVLHNFPYYGNIVDGNQPASGVIMTDTGWLIGTTPYGVAGDNYGMVFKVHP